MRRITITAIHRYIEDNYSEDLINTMLDEEILNWVDSDWEEDGDYTDEHEWYIEFSNGEAEDVVRNEIVNDIYSHFGLTRETYKSAVYSSRDLEDFINDLYPRLDK